MNIELKCTVCMQSRSIKESSTSHYARVFMLPLVLWVRTGIADCHIVAVWQKHCKSRDNTVNMDIWNWFLLCKWIRWRKKKNMQRACSNFALEEGTVHRNLSYLLLIVLWSQNKASLCELGETEVQFSALGTACHTHPPNSITLARTAATCQSQLPHRPWGWV